MSTSDKLSIAGIVLGIAGIVIGLATAYYFYRKSIREKKPCWRIQSYNIIRDYKSIITDVDVLYKGETVDNLTVSRILFWNDGELTLDGQDIQTRNHLRICTHGKAQLLDKPKVITQNNPSSHISVSPLENKKFAYVNFDYLDKNQGAIIQVIHTGRSSNDIDFVGDIKGAKLEKRVAASAGATPVLEVLDYLSFILGIGLAIIIFIIPFLALQPIFPELIRTRSGNPPPSATLFILIAVVVAIVLVSLRVYRSVITQRLSPPTGLEEFER